MAEGSDKNQEEVLKKKDHVTKSSIGLQKWGDDPMGDAIGTGSSGTAERAAKIKELQRESDDDQ